MNKYNHQKKTILFIGSYLSKKTGGKSIAEKLKPLFWDDYNIKLSSNKENKLLRLFEIIFSILFSKCDLIIIDVFSGPAFTIAYLGSFVAKKIRNKNLVFLLRGGMLPLYHATNQNKIEKVLKAANKIATPSIFIKNYFTAQGFKIEYLPNFIALDIFNSDNSIRKPYSILWIRSFRKIYNPKLAIITLHKILINFPEATLTMIGSDGGLLEECKNLISELGINDKVTITGSIKNEKLTEYYNSHSVYINTTFYESFGMSVMEAAACNIPIVSPSIGEIPFLWEEDKEMLFIKDFDPESMVSKISFLFSNSEIAKEMALNARKKAEQFSWFKIKTKWEEIFNTKKLLFIGNFLSIHKGNIGPTEKLSIQLSDKFYIDTASNKKNKFHRLYQIIIKIIFTKYDFLIIDVYSTQAFIFSQIASTLGCLKRTNVILNLHGGALPELYLRSPKKIRYLFSKANNIISPSNYLKDFFEKKGFRIKIIPNSIDLSKFAYERNNIKPFSLLWVRGFSSIYNPEIALRCLYEIKKSNPKVTLTMIGSDGGLLNEIKTISNSLGLGDSVIFKGPVNNDDLPKYYQTHEIFLNTTSYESFGIAVLEAASCGIPVVSSAVGEIPYIWKHNVDILLVNDFNPLSYSNVASRLFDNIDLANKISLSARKKANQYSIENIVPQWIKLFNE